VFIHVSKGIRDPRKDIADSWLRLDELNGRLTRLIDLIIREGKGRLTTEGKALMIYSPSNLISNLGRGISFQRHSLTLMVNRRFREKQMSLSLLEEKIKDLSPLSVLKRGYSITRKLPGKQVLKGVSGIDKGDDVNIILAEGELDCRIKKVTPGQRP
jgi:exodeoxyribonuclease VII large subunit